MQVSLSSLKSLAPILAIVLTSVIAGWLLARGDNATARRKRVSRDQVLRERTRRVRDFRQSAERATNRAIVEAAKAEQEAKSPPTPEGHN